MNTQKIFILLFSSILAVACSNNGKSQRGGQIIIGVNNDIETLNPLFSESSFSQEVAHLLLLGLADLDEKSNFKPELAESWKSSADHLKLTYYLRKDLKWSDGKPITAEDVKFTYDLLMDSSVASPRQGVCDFIKSVTADDPHTVTFEFTEAYPTQIYDTAGEIIPKHIFETVDRKEIRNHSFSRSPVSSGPYKLKEWKSQQYLELVPNDNYFAEPANIAHLVFKIIPDKTNLLMQLKSGEIDMLSDVPTAEIASLSKENKNIKLYQVDGRAYYFLAYNEKNPLFKTKAVRQALTMAIDRNKMIDGLLSGYGKECLGPFPPMLSWAFNNQVKGFEFDKDKAVELLNEAGWKDTNGDGVLDKGGKDFEFTIITSAGNQLKTDVAIVAQEQLKLVGVKANVEKLEWTTMIKHLQDKNFDACINGWNTPYYVDPTPVFHSTSTNLFNFISYSNPRIDQLIETGRVEMDRNKAAEIWKEFHQILYEDQPYTFLFWIDKAVAVNADFKNVTPLALSPYYDIENWYRSN